VGAYVLTGRKEECALRCLMYGVVFNWQQFKMPTFAGRFVGDPCAHDCDTGVDWDEVVQFVRNLALQLCSRMASGLRIVWELEETSSRLPGWLGDVPKLTPYKGAATCEAAVSISAGKVRWWESQLRD
jgi:hypothetical protein